MYSLLCSAAVPGHEEYGWYKTVFIKIDNCFIRKLEEWTRQELKVGDLQSDPVLTRDVLVMYGFCSFLVAPWMAGSDLHLSLVPAGCEEAS